MVQVKLSAVFFLVVASAIAPAVALPMKLPGKSKLKVITSFLGKSKKQNPPAANPPPHGPQVSSDSLPPGIKVESPARRSGSLASSSSQAYSTKATLASSDRLSPWDDHTKPILPPTVNRPGDDQTKPILRPNVKDGDKFKRPPLPAGPRNVNSESQPVKPETPISPARSTDSMYTDASPKADKIDTPHSPTPSVQELADKIKAGSITVFQGAPGSEKMTRG